MKCVVKLLCAIIQMSRENDASQRTIKESISSICPHFQHLTKFTVKSVCEVVVLVVFQINRRIFRVTSRIIFGTTGTVFPQNCQDTYPPMYVLYLPSYCLYSSSYWVPTWSIQRQKPARAKHVLPYTLHQLLELVWLKLHKMCSNEGQDIISDWHPPFTRETKPQALWVGSLPLGSLILEIGGAPTPLTHAL